MVHVYELKEIYKMPTKINLKVKIANLDLCLITFALSVLMRCT